MKSIAGFLSLVALAAGPVAAQSQVHQPAVDLAWNRLRTYDEIVDALRRLAAAHPDLVTLASIGTSSQGRELWLATVNNRATGPDTAKAAIWIDGNIHGNEVQAADTCLYTIWYLTEYHGRIDAVTRLVDERAFYILPSVNPDGRAYWFAEPNTAHSARSGMRPTDSDGDGAFDEDGPDDLDGDGEITQMRKRVAGGDHVAHPHDPRLLVRVEPGQRGEFVLLGSEGIDNDGDGRINEDGPGGYDLNRNWPSGWQPDYVQHGAGDYPFSHPETRAIGDFVLEHPNIAAFQSYHNAGGMILRGPGSKEREDVYPRPDRQVYDALGKAGERMLPFYRYMIIHEDLYTVHGGEVNWAAEGLGIISYTNELWSQRQLPGALSEAPEFTRGRGEGDDDDAGPYDRRYGRLADERERMDLSDRLLLGEAFADWTEVDHPTYGKIEVGGFKRMYGRVPPAWMIEEMLHRNTAFTLYHADQMPRPVIDALESRSIGDGLHEIDLTVRNARLIPTITARAADGRVGRRDLAELTGDGLEVLAGGRLEGRVDHRFVPVDKVPGRLWFDRGLGSHGVLRLRWIVRGAGTATVAYDAEKGGRVEATVVLGE